MLPCSHVSMFPLFHVSIIPRSHIPMFPCLFPCSHVPMFVPSPSPWHPALPGWALSWPCASQMCLICTNSLGVTFLGWLKCCFLSPCGPELFSFRFYWISGHLLSEQSQESIPMNEWMYIPVLIADKHVYLLLCMHLMQDFCTDPSSSACCSMGQAKLSLSSWRSWDFNVICAARSSSTMAPAKRKTLNFLHWCQSTVHKMLFMIPFKQ